MKTNIEAKCIHKTNQEVLRLTEMHEDYISFMMKRNCMQCEGYEIRCSGYSLVEDNNVKMRICYR